MILQIALRNIQRTLGRNSPALFLLLLSFSIITIANSVTQTISDNYSTIYTNYLTSNYSISHKDGGFTIFGSEVLLLGRFIIPPIIPNIDNVVDRLNRDEAIPAWAGLLTLPVELRNENNSSKGEFIAFGVDFSSYLKLFPDLELLSGYCSSEDMHAVMLQPEQHEVLGSPEIGEPLTMLSSDGYNYNLRTVELAGVFTYPIEDDPVLSRVILTSANAVRSLAGYLTQARVLQELSEDEQYLFTSEIDTLFVTQEEAEVDEDAPLDLDQIGAVVSSSNNGAPSGSVEKTAWHFLLFDDESISSLSQARQKFQDNAVINAYRILDWRRTAGGSAQIIVFLQIIINLGIAIIIAGTLLIITNLIVLSLLERSQEIATMRAVGASKNRVILIISTEILVTIFCTALCGIVFGIILVPILNLFEISIDNPYFQTLFAGQTIQAKVGIEVLIRQMILCVLISTISVVYPLRKVLKISPREALL